MWDGRGLPPVAAERARRAAEGGAWTSLLSAPSAVALGGAGFDPVGEVMGSMVERIGWAGYRGCGGYGIFSTTVTSSDRRRYAGYGPYVQAVETGYATAMSRMLLEASTIGADGVVGVALERKPHGNGAYEFTAMGTAVRARSRTRPARVFSTHLPGTDVAKLVVAGWIPTDLVFGISVSIRHDDLATRRQSSWGAGNVEVSGYTDLVVLTRADARRRFTQHVKAAGADGAIVDAMSLRVWDIEPSDNHRDHIAEATIFGTALARFHRRGPAPTRSLTYLPLNRRDP